MMYSPVSFELALRVRLVSTLIAVTAMLGTIAPLLSVTVPEMEAVVAGARTANGKNKANRTLDSASRRICFDTVDYPLQRL